MIDKPKYGEMELMQEIRNKYGTERTIAERATEASGAVQDGLRSGESESGQPSEPSIGRDESHGRKPRKTRRDIGVTRGSYRRKGRANSKVTQVSSGVDRSDRPTDRAIQFDKRESDRIEEKGDYAEKEKPSGIAAKPNAKERKIRAEAEAEAAAKQSTAAEAEAAPSFFAWIRPRNKGKTSKGEKSSTVRDKPLSSKEAGEIRQPLIDAMGDYFHYADELMSGTSANGAEAEIWSSIDDEELGILVDAWLARAQKDPIAAHYAVQAVNSHYKLKIGMILAPRFYQTFRFYVDNGIRSPFPAQRRKQREKRRRPLSVVTRDN